SLLGLRGTAALRLAVLGLWFFLRCLRGAGRGGRRTGFAVLVIIMNSLKIKNRANAIVQGCDGCCATCAHAKEEGKEAQK
ncbi:MAG: hypothetical protein EGQ17_05085, partial [Lachnospiraceae bacterium]|nr:hypothetical protein [Lachnospiraceae bacterium]